jgi:hypothetical protein
MLKGDLMRLARTTEPWKRYRRRLLHAAYDARRERYDAIVRAKGAVYRESDVGPAVAKRLRSRGYEPKVRSRGEVHTFAFIPRIGWHAALYPDLALLGPVSDFDYAAEGYTAEEFSRGTEADEARRVEMNEKFVARVREVHARQPIDWIYVYASGLEILGSTLRRIRDAIGVPIVNMCLDDKQSWEGAAFGGQRNGQVDIARQFDLCWTSARIACDWYLAEDAVPVYMPEGFDQMVYRPMDVPRDIDVSFIGGAYGFRSAVVEFLRKHGVDIRVYGTGWKTTSVWGEKQIKVINRSAINLGMGGIGYSEELTNVKTRDFEIPGTGGGLYLTSFNPDLALHFRIGEEIVCYRNRDEMLELIRYYLRRPEEARAIADRARQRCLRDHRWLHRYDRVCQLLGILI